MEREKGESANDRNDRAIREAAKWYQNHLNDHGNGSSLTVVLVTNDTDNRTKAINRGIDSFTSQ